MKKYKILKEAFVLLIAMTILISSTGAIANKTTSENKLTLSIEDLSGNPSSSGIKGVIYDNGMGDLVGALAAQDERPLGGTLDAFPADDFILNQPAIIEDVHWQGGYYNCQAASGPMDYKFDWNITFYADNGKGTAPGAAIAEYHFPNATIVVDFWYNETERWYANYSVELPDPLELDFGIKYWISIYGIGLSFPQSGWCRHNETVLGIKFHEAVFKSSYFGFLDWTNTTDLVGEANDFNFALTGELIPVPELEINITGGIGLTATVINSGSMDATNVTADFNISGGFILLPLGGVKTGVDIGTVSKDGGTGPGKCMVFGIGKPTVTVDVTCDEGVTASATYTPKLVILFFVI